MTNVFVFPAKVSTFRGPETPEAMICACWRNIRYGYREMLEASIAIFNNAGVEVRKVDPAEMKKEIVKLIEEAAEHRIHGPKEFINQIMELAGRMKAPKQLPSR